MLYFVSCCTTAFRYYRHQLAHQLLADAFGCSSRSRSSSTITTSTATGVLATTALAPTPFTVSASTTAEQELLRITYFDFAPASSIAQILQKHHNALLALVGE